MSVRSAALPCRLTRRTYLRRVARCDGPLIWWCVIAVEPSLRILNPYFMPVHGQRPLSNTEQNKWESAQVFLLANCFATTNNGTGSAALLLSVRVAVRYYHGSLRLVCVPRSSKTINWRIVKLRAAYTYMVLGMEILEFKVLLSTGWVAILIYL